MKAGIFFAANEETKDLRARGTMTDLEKLTLEMALKSKTIQNSLIERIAQLTAHRVCCGAEHDPSQGKLHGCCVICGVPWPCEYAGAKKD